MLSVFHETAIVIEPLPRKQITQYLGAKDFPDVCFQFNETTCCVYLTPLCPLTWYVISSLLETREVRYFHFKPSAPRSSFWTFIEVEGMASAFFEVLTIVFLFLAQHLSFIDFFLEWSFPLKLAFESVWCSIKRV